MILRPLMLFQNLTIGIESLSLKYVALEIFAESEEDQVLLNLSEKPKEVMLFHILEQTKYFKYNDISFKNSTKSLESNLKYPKKIFMSEILNAFFLLMKEISNQTFYCHFYDMTTYDKKTGVP